MYKYLFCNSFYKIIINLWEVNNNICRVSIPQLIFDYNVNLHLFQYIFLSPHITLIIFFLIVTSTININTTIIYIRSSLQELSINYEMFIIF